MRARGIQVPDPTAAGQRPGALIALAENLVSKYGQTVLQNAITACQRYVVASFPRVAFTPAQQAQRLKAAFTYVRCMRARGFDLPDPRPNGTGDLGLGRALAALNQNAPAFKSANEACITAATGG